MALAALFTILVMNKINLKFKISNGAGSHFNTSHR